MKRIYIIIGIGVLLLASCGRRQEAKSIIKDFMKANVEDYSKVDYLEFYDIDSHQRFAHSGDAWSDTCSLQPQHQLSAASRENPMAYPHPLPDGQRHL